MTEMKGFNLKRILLKNIRGYFCFGFYKDGMILPEGGRYWTLPKEWDGWLSIKELNQKIEDCMNKTKDNTKMATIFEELRHELNLALNNYDIQYKISDLNKITEQILAQFNVQKKGE